MANLISTLNPVTSSQRSPTSTHRPHTARPSSLAAACLRSRERLKPHLRRTDFALQTGGSQHPEVCQIECVDSIDAALGRALQEQSVVDFSSRPTSVGHSL